MTCNARTRQGQKYLRKAGLRRVYLDGVLIPWAYYTDGRRGVVRAFVQDEKEMPAYDPKTNDVATYEKRGRQITFEVIQNT